jgi:hypothetical protein
MQSSVQYVRALERARSVHATQTLSCICAPHPCLSAADVCGPGMHVQMGPFAVVGLVGAHWHTEQSPARALHACRRSVYVEDEAGHPVCEAVFHGPAFQLISGFAQQHVVGA